MFGAIIVEMNEIELTVRCTVHVNLYSDFMQPLN